MTALQFLGVLALIALCTLITGNVIFGVVAALVVWIVGAIANAILGAALDGLVSGLRRIFGGWA